MTFGFPPNMILVCGLFVFLDLNSREQETCQPVHVINVDIQDNHEEATLGAFLICELCQCVSILFILASVGKRPLQKLAVMVENGDRLLLMGEVF